MLPTFSKDVAPILYKHCVSCHRPGEIAPMSLLTYEQARPYAKAIANAIGESHHAAVARGRARRHVSQRASCSPIAERKTLTAWATGGAPNGDPKDLPAQPVFAEGWSLGKPDVVLEMLEDYRIPARGTIQYEWFYIPTQLHRTEMGEVDRSQAGRSCRRSPCARVLPREARRQARPPIARGNQKDQSNPPPDEPGVMPSIRSAPI